jgi:hypothetical protein
VPDSPSIARAKAALAEGRSIIDGAKGRPMTASERRQVEQLIAEANHLGDRERLTRQIDELNGGLTPPAATKMNRPGSDGGSGYWIPTPAGSACWAA